jgi:hypothetical protein
MKKHSQKPPASSTTTNVALKSGAESNGSSTLAVANNGRLSASTRRAQFQASRRIMSAPIRPTNNDDSKNKRKATRKKKVIRLVDAIHSNECLSFELAFFMSSYRNAIPSMKQHQKLKTKIIVYKTFHSFTHSFSTALLLIQFLFMLH